MCGDAARGGHIALLEELSGRYPLCLETSALAARGDYPKTKEVFAWLRSRGCPWDKWTTASACGEGKGSLQTLKFLHAQGVPLGKECFAKAAISGDLEVLEWLGQMGCPWDWTATHHAREDEGSRGCKGCERLAEEAPDRNPRPRTRPSVGGRTNKKKGDDAHIFNRARA